VFITGYTSTVQNALRVYGLGLQKTNIHYQAGIETGTDFPPKTNDCEQEEGSSRGLLTSFPSVVANTGEEPKL
jgi:hypothetical protein